MRGYWTCQRQTKGQKCRKQNRNSYRICRACGKKRPPRKRPAHMAALDVDYAFFVELNGGDHCGICGKQRGEYARRFDRDHCHKTGTRRGLLCHSCNRTLGRHVDLDWLRKAYDYLERTAA